MENLNQKKRRLYGKKYIHNYIKELNALTNIKIVEKNLLSIVESDRIVCTNIERTYRAKILFNDKERLLLFIGDLLKLKDSQAYLSIAYSVDCGLLKMKSLKEFNINFKFEDEHSGLIVIILEDLSNKLVLDFYEENKEYYLEIETYGNDWSKARVLT